MPRSRLRATSRQTVDLLRPSREAMADMLRPHTSPSAMNMRSSMLRYLGPVGFGCGMAASVHSAHGPRCGPCCASCRCATPYQFSWRRRRRGRPPRSPCPRARARRSDAPWRPASRLASRRRFLRIRIPQKTLSEIHGVATTARIHPVQENVRTPPFFFTSEGTLRDSRKSLQFRLPVPAASCFLVQEIVGTFPVAVPG